MGELIESNLQAELMLTQAEVLRLSELNEALAERLAEAEAETRKQTAALKATMEEGHYRLYVRYRNQRDEYADQLAQALNQVTIEEDARVLAESKYEHLIEKIKELHAEWSRLPVWGPNPQGYLILDEVDLDHILKGLQSLLPEEQS